MKRSITVVAQIILLVVMNLVCIFGIKHSLMIAAVLMFDVILLLSITAKRMGKNSALYKTMFPGN